MGFETGLGHGIGNGSTLRQNRFEPDKKTFGKTFGAATGVSDPRLQKIQAPVCTLGPQATSIKRGIGNAVVDWLPRGHTNPVRHDAPIGAWILARCLRLGALFFVDLPRRHQLVGISLEVFGLRETWDNRMIRALPMEKNLTQGAFGVD